MDRIFTSEILWYFQKYNALMLSFTDDKYNELIEKGIKKFNISESDFCLLATIYKNNIKKLSKNL